MWPASLIQIGRIRLDPTPNATGIHFHTPLAEDFGDMFVGQRKPEIPANAQQDHFPGIMASFERIRRGNRHGLSTLSNLVPPISQWSRQLYDGYRLSKQARRTAQDSLRSTCRPSISGNHGRFESAL